METSGIPSTGATPYTPGGIKHEPQQPESPQKAAQKQNLQAQTAGAAQELEKKKLEFTGPPPHVERKDIETEEAEEREPVENEEALIADMTKNIKETSYKVSKKVNKSAYRYMKDNKKWLKAEISEDAEKFFTIKIPKVLAQELSSALNAALGLVQNNEEEEEET